MAVTRRCPTYFAPSGYPEALRIRREFNEGRLVTIVVVVARRRPPIYLPRLVVQKAFALGANLTKGIWLQSLWL